MSQKQQNKFLVVYGIVTGVIALGLGYLCFSQSQASDEADETLAAEQKKLENLRSAPIYPKDDHVKLKKKEVDAYAAEVDKLNQSVLAFQPPLNTEIIPDKVQQNLGSYKNNIINAATARKVALPQTFDFGLTRYKDAAPLKSATPQVNFLVESLNVLLTTIVEGNITKLELIDSPEQPYEKAAAETPAPTPGARTTTRSSTTSRSTTSRNTPDPKKEQPPAVLESEVLTRYPIKVAFTGNEQSVQGILNRLAATPQGGPFFVVNSIRIENEKKDGPPRTPWAAPPPPAPPEPAVISHVILGSEKVTAYLDMDLIYFSAPAK